MNPGSQDGHPSHARIWRWAWLLVCASACGPDSSEASSSATETRATEERGPIGKADLSGSCAGQPNHCGGKSPGNCWCDDTCVAHGDCCSDYGAVCDGVCWGSLVAQSTQFTKMRTRAVTFQGSRLYTATHADCTNCGDRGGISVFDVSDPKTPIGLHDASRTVEQLFGSAIYSGFPIDLDVDGDRAAMIGLGGGGGYNPYLWTFDMSSSGAKTQRAAMPLPDVGLSLYAVAVQGQYAYVASSKGVYVVWIGNLADPRIVSRIATTSRVRDVAVDSAELYLAIEQGGVQRYDISNSDSPALVGASSSFAATQIALDDDMLYVLGDHAYDNSLDALRVIDWSNPAAPAVIGSLSYVNPSSIALDGDAAYVAGPGAVVVDISDPSDPTLVYSGAHAQTPIAVATNGVAVAYVDGIDVPGAAINIFWASCLRSGVGGGGGGNPTPCAHDVCETGVALTSSCDPCAATVCNADPFCCNTKWDSLCASRAGSLCGSCN